jgi:hypothetical protein
MQSAAILGVESNIDLPAEENNSLQKEIENKLEIEWLKY